MVFQLVSFLLALAMPVWLGWLLARLFPAWAPGQAAGLASISLLLCFLWAAAAFYAAVEPASCGDEPCGDVAPYGLAALLIFGAVSLLVGFGLGLIGHWLGRRKRDR